MERGGGWTGFSDEDLRKLKQSANTEESSGEKIKSTNTRSTGNRPRRAGQNPLSAQTSSDEVLPADQRLSASTEQASERKTAQRIVDKKSTQHHSESSQANQNDLTGTGLTAEMGRKPRMPATALKTNISGEEPGSLPSTAQKVSPRDGEELPELVLDESSILARELMSMGKFREQQKMMEELNKKKKAMLTCALKERTKKAKVEAVRLTLIRQELEKLDQLVVSDVSIIRNKIEESSREYLEAQKRYNRAEKEFIESKLDLHKKLEYKDQLTEHLFTVIHQNEQRKAKKLSQLMERLEMDTDAEDGEVEDLSTLTLPPLCLISPVESRKSCLQTLPGFSSSPSTKDSSEKIICPSAGGHEPTPTVPASDVSHPEPIAGNPVGISIENPVGILAESAIVTVSNQ